MKTLDLSAALLVTAAALAPRPAQAHCQVPCGIYDDHARVHAMREDATTIEKAVKMIGELAKKKDAQSANQMVRWINTKEQHAERVIRTVADYFLTQKLKPVAAKSGKEHAAYLQKLEAHHAVMVAAMKCKQTVSADAVAALSKALDGIEMYWPAK